MLQLIFIHVQRNLKGTMSHQEEENRPHWFSYFSQDIEKVAELAIHFHSGHALV